MEMQIGMFGSLLFVALIVGGFIIKVRRDVLHGPFVERGLSKRMAAIAAP